MLKVDMRRMFLAPFFYITVGISLVVPILILVMTTMMDGCVSVHPQTGKEPVMEGFDYVKCKFTKPLQNLFKLLTEF